MAKKNQSQLVTIKEENILLEKEDHSTFKAILNNEQRVSILSSENVSRIDYEALSK